MRFIQKAVIMHPTNQTFLVLKRSEQDKFRPGTWDLPGGCALYGELHVTALTREIIEETGLSVTVPQTIFAATSFDPQQPMYLLLLGARCRALSAVVTLSSEHEGFAWITPAEFLAQDPDYTFIENRPLNLQSTDFLRDIVYTGLCKS